MLEKIKKLQKYSLWNNLRDIRFLGFLVFGLLVVLASWSGVKVIETNYDLQKQAAQIDQQNQLQELTNKNLKLENEYYNTDTYLELTARKQLGKGAPGETLILVPKEVALAHVKALPETKPILPTKQLEEQQPGYQKNFRDWLDFFFRSNAT